MGVDLAALDRASSISASRDERRALRGGPGLWMAVAAGAAAALAHPPFGIWPGVFGFGLMLHTLDTVRSDRPLRSAFFRGWAAGFGYLLVGTWWIAEAFFVDAAAHGWQAPFAVLFTAGGISVFWGGAGLLYRLVRPKGPLRVLSFAAVLTLFEWLRGHVLTGFPWDLPGECWRAGSAPSQGASLIGAYGMTFVTIAIGASTVVLWRADDRRFRVATLGSAALALTLLWGFGAWRLAHADNGVTALRLRVVQPGLGEEAVWTEANVRARYERFMQLTTWPAARPPQVVIWPEGAIPGSFNDYLAPGTWTLRELSQALRPDQLLLAGGSRTGGSAAAPRYYNSLLALRRTPTGLQPLATYDKYRLVPFGEFLPTPWLFGALGVKSLVQNGEPFTPGPRPAPISIPGLPRVQPLICYESLFPGFTSSKGGRPAWIVNISDDAWFGKTTGPLQHLNLASYRAIEEGLPIVRSTPTGVSAVVDGYGRVRQSLGLGRAGVIDAALPDDVGITPYDRVRDVPLSVFIIAGLSLRFIKRRVLSDISLQSS